MIDGIVDRVVGCRIVVAVLTFALGCDRVYGLSGRSEDGGDMPQVDAPGDGASPGDSPPRVLQCGTPSDSFDVEDVDECGAWGTAVGPSQAFTRAGGRLGVVSSSYYAAVCRATAMVDLATGVVLEVASVTGSTTSEVALLRASSASGFVSIGVLGGTTLEFRTEATAITIVQYAPTAMRWWRLVEDGGAVTASVSANGTSWNDLGIALDRDAGPAWQIDFGVIPTEGTVAMEVSSFNCVPAAP